MWIKNSLVLMSMFVVSAALSAIMGFVITAAYKHGGLVGAIAAVFALLAIISMFGGYIITKEYSN